MGPTNEFPPAKSVLITALVRDLVQVLIRRRTTPAAQAPHYFRPLRRRRFETSTETSLGIYSPRQRIVYQGIRSGDRLLRGPLVSEGWMAAPRSTRLPVRWRRDSTRRRRAV